jgi:hypothetical protein
MKKLLLITIPVLLAGCSLIPQNKTENQEILQKINELEQKLELVLEENKEWKEELSWQNKVIPQENTICTMDAKQCPDGTYVSRTWPNCEFSPCLKTTKTEEQNCLWEWKIANQNDPNEEHKDCCPWLKYFEYRAPSASSTPMCYDQKKWTPKCLYWNTEKEWRYYPNWTALYLKKNNEAFYPCNDL